MGKLYNLKRFPRALQGHIILGGIVIGIFYYLTKSVYLNMLIIVKGNLKRAKEGWLASNKFSTAPSICPESFNLIPSSIPEILLIYPFDNQLAVSLAPLKVGLFYSLRSSLIHMFFKSGLVITSGHHHWS